MLHFLGEGSHLSRTETPRDFCASEIKSLHCSRPSLLLFCLWGQVGEEAWIAVKSTCPCNFTLHYEVASRGNIVLSGLQPSNITQQRSKRATVPFEKNMGITRLPGTGSYHQIQICPHSQGKNLPYFCKPKYLFFFHLVHLKGNRIVLCKKNNYIRGAHRKKR